MTFEWDAAEAEVVARARAIAEGVVSGAAAAIDASGVVPGTVWQALDAASLRDPVAAGGMVAVGILEALGEASAGVAVAFGLTSGRGGPPDPRGQAGSPWVGLRGSAVELEAVVAAGPGRLPAARLVLAATALGVGRAAVAEAVGAMRQRGARPSNDETTPHWQLADAATEVESARLLTLQAAQSVDVDAAGETAVASAARYAAAAAQRAVEAAMAIAGADSGRQGAVLERLARDARTIALLAADFAIS